MKKRKKKKTRFIISIFLIILILSLILNVYFFTNVRKINFNIPQLSTNGYSLVNIQLQPEQIILSRDCRAIIMFISPEQTINIAKGIENKTEFRPYTHDTLVNIIDVFDIEVLMLKITDLKEGTYFAKLFLKENNKVVSLDVRPSDGIAVAVRKNIDVYVKDDLLSQGVNIC